MFRVALLLFGGAFASGCVCKPLDCHTAGCIDEATAVSTALQSAEDQWLSIGECFGPALGESGSGSWVVGDGPGFCGQVDYFDKRGKLRATRHCCEADCTERGLGFKPARGPLRRDLCKEARAGLVEAGPGMYASSAVTLRNDAGVVEPILLNPSRTRWHLSPGVYEASERSATVLARFEVPADGGVVIPLDRNKTHCDAWRCQLSMANSLSLAFTTALTRPDGGTP